MGANGAGKSLYIRLLHGLLTPDSGLVLWKGEPMTHQHRKHQAMVFQRPVLLRRSVAANLRFALSVKGFARNEWKKRQDNALSQSKLSGRANTPARVLSGGEQQRLALTRALACDPEILFLDEPTASLDPASTLAIEQLIIDANRSGVSIVMITHDLAQARRIGHRMQFLHAGNLVETGSVEELTRAPQADATRAWMEGRLFS